MSTQTPPVEAGCRCDRVRLRLSAPALLTMACHCRGCQKMTGSAYSLSVAIPNEGFAVTAGEPVIGGLHGPHRHFFCPWCMSWMFTRPEGLDFFVNVRATLLDDATGFVPFVETVTDEALPWAKTPALHSFGGFPPMEAYDGLLAEFAQWRPGEAPADRSLTPVPGG